MSEVKRGEIYWVKNQLTKETGDKKARPALIISTPEDGDPYKDVNIIYLTTNPRDERASNIVIERTNNGQCEGSTALCGKVHFIAEACIWDEDYICRLSYEDMERVDQTLARRMGLDYLANCSKVSEVEVAEPYEYEPETNEYPTAPSREKLVYVNEEKIRKNMENEIKARFYEQKYNELLAMIMNR